jgi:GT2 family glycosyltransferase
MSTYKRSNRLAGIMAALAAQSVGTSRFEVIVVDNCSGDDTWATLTALATEVPFALRLLQTYANNGPAPARNLGWHEASAAVVAFLDDDCLPEPGWLAAGLDLMHRDEKLGVVQGRVRPPDDFDPTSMGTWYHCQIIDAPSPYFEACNIFYRRAALYDGRGFDESIGWWCEDTTLGWHVVEAGWSRGFAHDAVVVHEVQDRGWKWYFRNGLLERNTVKMAGDHPGFRLAAFWRPWAYRREDAGFVLAVVGILAAIRFRPAILMALPYVWWRRPRMGMPRPLDLALETVAVDAARSVGQLRGALLHRVLVI